MIVPCKSICGNKPIGLVFLVAIAFWSCESPTCKFLPDSNEAILWEYTVDVVPDGMFPTMAELGADASLYLAGTIDESGSADWLVAHNSPDGEDWVASLGEEDGAIGVGPGRGSLHALPSGGVLVATPAGRLFRLSSDGGLDWSEPGFLGRACLSSASDSGLAVICNSDVGRFDLVRYNPEGTELWSQEVSSAFPVLHRGGEVSLVRELGDAAVLVIHLDVDGNSVWSRSVGFEQCRRCVIRSVQSLADCGLLVLAWEAHEDGVQGTYVVQIDCAGQVLHGGKWNNRKNDYLAETVASGLVILAGTSCSKKQRESDVVLIGMNDRGDVVSERWFGREAKEGAVSIREFLNDEVAVAATQDGGFWVFGVAAN